MRRRFETLSHFRSGDPRIPARTVPSTFPSGCPGRRRGTLRAGTRSRPRPSRRQSCSRGNSSPGGRPGRERGHGEARHSHGPHGRYTSVSSPSRPSPFTPMTSSYEAGTLAPFDAVPRGRHQDDPRPGRVAAQSAQGRGVRRRLHPQAEIHHPRPRLESVRQRPLQNVRRRDESAIEDLEGEEIGLRRHVTDHRGDGGSVTGRVLDSPAPDEPRRPRRG